jgi:hypothetical protein
VKSENGKSGFVSSTGKWLTGPVYDECGQFGNGLVPVRQADLWGYVNQTGKVVIAPKFRNAQAFHDGLAVVSRDNRNFELIDQQGRTRIAAPPGRYITSIRIAPVVTMIAGNSKLVPFAQNLAKRSADDDYVEPDVRYGFADLHGRTVIKPKFAYANYFSDGLALVGRKQDFNAWVQEYAKTRAKAPVHRHKKWL